MGNLEAAAKASLTCTFNPDDHNDSQKIAAVPSTKQKNEMELVRSRTQSGLTGNGGLDGHRLRRRRPI